MRPLLEGFVMTDNLLLWTILREKPGHAYVTSDKILIASDVEGVVVVIWGQNLTEKTDEELNLMIVQKLSALNN